MPVRHRVRHAGADHEPVGVSRVRGQVAQHLPPLRDQRVGDGEPGGRVEQGLATPPDQRQVVVAVRRGAVLRRERLRQVQLAVRAGREEVQVEVDRPAQQREERVPQHRVVHGVPVGEPDVVQRPGEVADLRSGAARRADAAGAEHVGAAAHTGRVGPVRARHVVDELLAVGRERAGDRVELQMVGAVDQPVLQLDVEVPPDRRPRASAPATGPQVAITGPPARLPAAIL